MPRVYTVEFDAVSVSAVQDFFEITPGDDKPLTLLGLVLSQYGTADFGDAQAEGLGIKIVRGYTVSGSGGTAATAVPLDPGDASAGFTCEVNNTTQANTGSPVTVWADGFNVQVGYQMWFPENCQPKVNQGQTSLVCRLIGAPADALSTMNGTLVVAEG